MAEDVRDALNEYGEDEVDRGETGIRIALTVLFALITAVLRAALGLIVIFELLWTLVMKQAPSPRLRDFANRIIAYYYRIVRYMTYNESRVPFPFADFPAALEGDAWSPDDRESEALGLSELDDRDETENNPR